MADSLTGEASEKGSTSSGRGVDVSGPPSTLQLTRPPSTMMDIHDDEVLTSASTSAESQKRKISDAGVALSLLDESPTKTRPLIIAETSSQGSPSTTAAATQV